jgi:hypothetical protein
MWFVSRRKHARILAERDEVLGDAVAAAAMGEQTYMARCLNQAWQVESPGGDVLVTGITADTDAVRLTDELNRLAAENAKLRAALREVGQDE